MSEAKRTEFTNKNGDKLIGLSWEIEKNNANVIIMEGMEEHCSRYDAFAKHLNKEGFSVYSIDVYGQGENVKPDFSNRGIWPVDGFVKQVQAIISPYIKTFTTEISLLEKNENENKNYSTSTPDMIKMNIIYKNQKSHNSLAILLRKY